MTAQNSKVSAGPLVVKIGGKVAESDEKLHLLAAELRDASAAGKVLLVHGGGITISSLQDRFGIEPRFVDGKRRTSPDEMPLVDMALAGAVNKRLVRMLCSAGAKGWGLSGADGGILRAESDTGDAAANRTGTITEVDTSVFEAVWNAGFLPVLAPPATDQAGRGINVNADEAALAVACALKAENLIFISDVPGVLEKGIAIKQLTPPDIEKKIITGVIDGGMIPKTRSAVGALENGVAAVTIGDYSASGDLKALISGSRGTRIEIRRENHG